MIRFTFIDDTVVYINSDHVVSIQPYNTGIINNRWKGTVITLVGDTSTVVKEDVEQVRVALMKRG